MLELFWINAAQEEDFTRCSPLVLKKALTRTRLSRSFCLIIVLTMSLY